MVRLALAGGGGGGWGGKGVPGWMKVAYPSIVSPAKAHNEVRHSLQYGFRLPQLHTSGGLNASQVQ